MRIALAQLNPTIGALRENTDAIKDHYRLGEKGGADLVVFTELALCGYPPRDLLLYESFLNRERELLTEEVLPLTEGSGPPIMIGATHRQGNRLYNGAFILENGNIKSIHLKTLLPYFEVFDEERYFTRCTDRQIEMLGNLKTAVTVCEDIWNDRDFFPNQLYDVDPLEWLFTEEPRLLINLSASPSHLGKHRLREEMLSFLAKKYKSGIIYLNQVGGNDELIFDGSSLVFNDRGELLYRAAACDEELFFIETDDLFQPAKKNVDPDSDDIGTVLQLLKLGTGDYVRKTGFSRAVLGLSGGIDSAVVAARAAEALGPENVLGLIMPSPYSSRHSVEDAVELAGNLGIAYRIIEIDRPFETYINLLNEGEKPLQDVAEENLQARIRGDILMHFSNREGYMALVAGNKSELAVGYCTLYGDMAGGLGVISDLPKMKVYELAEHLNNIKGKTIIPRRTINKAPSAELSPGQKDEDSLPPYEVLDQILEMYVEQNRSPAEIIEKGYAGETVEQVVLMVDRAEFKRHQAAPGLRITSRAFGRGWRMPIARGYEYSKKV